jgi:hypothetical protein
MQNTAYWHQYVHRFVPKKGGQLTPSVYFLFFLNIFRRCCPKLRLKILSKRF